MIETYKPSTVRCLQCPCRREELPAALRIPARSADPGKPPLSAATYLSLSITKPRLYSILLLHPPAPPPLSNLPIPCRIASSGFHDTYRHFSMCASSTGSQPETKAIPGSCVGCIHMCRTYKNPSSGEIVSASWLEMATFLTRFRTCTRQCVDQISAQAARFACRDSSPRDVTRTAPIAQSLTKSPSLTLLDSRYIALCAQ